MSKEKKQNPISGAMPAPPDFLVNPVNSGEESGHSIIRAEITEKVKTPVSIDYSLYQSALEDRKQAEISSAEIYSKYLELINFNERQMKTIGNLKRFQRRSRLVYNRAKIGDQIIAENLLLTQRSLIATEKAMNALQIENETLKISLSAHDEAFKNVTSKLGQAEATMDHANSQFRLLAEEFDKRGMLLDDADRKIKGYTIQIDQMGTAMREMQARFSQMRDDNLLYQNQMRDSQIREAGIAALNEELTNTVTKLQKQIHELEDRVHYERENSKTRINTLEQEVLRLKDKRYAEHLIEKSKKIQEQPLPQPKQNTSEEKTLDRQNLDQFLSRWTKIIDELSSQSSRISDTLKTEKPQTPTETSPETQIENEDFQESRADKISQAIREQLISERGDIYILD